MINGRKIHSSTVTNSNEMQALWNYSTASAFFYYKLCQVTRLKVLCKIFVSKLITLETVNKGAFYYLLLPTEALTISQLVIIKQISNNFAVRLWSYESVDGG